MYQFWKFGRIIHKNIIFQTPLIYRLYVRSIALHKTIANQTEQKKRLDLEPGDFFLVSRFEPVTG